MNKHTRTPIYMFMQILELKNLLYIAWVRPRQEYASVLWSPYTKRIERLPA